MNPEELAAVLETLANRLNDANGTEDWYLVGNVEIDLDNLAHDLRHRTTRTARPCGCDCLIHEGGTDEQG